MADVQQQILRGTLDLLILKALSADPAHGYAIARWIERATDRALHIEDGSLYPALYRLEERKLIDAEWQLTDGNRRAKYYTLTSAGRKRLRDETASWTRYARAIFAALDISVNVRAARA